MSKKEKAKQESMLESGRPAGLRENCLYALFEKSEALSVWKHREAARRLLKALMVITVIVALGAAAAIWFLLPDLDVNTRNNYLIITAGVAVGLLVLFGIIRAAVSSSCKKTFVEYSISEEKAGLTLDALKREQLDPMLENRIIVCVRSLLEAEAQFCTDDSNDGDYKFVDENETHTVKIDEPANSVLVTLDGHEVGAIDLTSEFSMFHVDPGLHSLKLKIKKDYYEYEKTLELETPTNPINLNGDYRIVYYAIQARAMNGRLQYALKVYEYDDMVTFLRDIHKTDVAEKIEQNIELSRKLKKRAKKLSRLLLVDDVDSAEAEKALFGSEKVMMDEVARCLRSADHDARFRRDPKIELFANVNSVSTIRREKKSEE